MPEKRWKAAERYIVAELNTMLSDIGNFTPIERIPLLGREGPDLTVNETGLVINVKSRQCIPTRLIPGKLQMLFIGDLAIFRLSEMSAMVRGHYLVDPIPEERWKQLQDWYDWMDKWTQEFQAGGISAIILHRPRMPYGSAGVAIHHENLRRLQCNLTKTNPVH